MSSATIIGVFALASFLGAQTPPTVYTIVENVASPPEGSTMTIYRSGARALTDVFHAAQDGSPATHTFTLYDIKAGASYSWDPATSPPSCGAGTFSGDWGDPFAMTEELTKGIAKGDFKLAGTETVSSIPAQIYTGSTGGSSVKAWLDRKDGLVLRAMIGSSATGLVPLVNITSVRFAPPPESVFALPTYCKSVHPPPTPAELISTETGDNAANWVNAIYGPGSKNSCSILVHVVAAKTLAPLNRHFQAAIDTTYNQDDPHPPGYTFGVGRDGVSTYSGGGLHEITSQIRNFTVQIDNPPAYFNFGINIPTPNNGASVGLIYRQCFAPVTNLYYILNDPANPGNGGDWLYAKSGKYALPPHP